MRLHTAVTQYIAYKHSLGMKFASDGRVLKSFARLHGNKDLNAIGPERVMAFLDGKGPLTSFFGIASIARSAASTASPSPGDTPAPFLCRGVCQNCHSASCRTSTLMPN